MWLIAASQWLVTDTVVPWDAKNQFYAFFRFLASSIHAGSTPFWNPYHYGGHPSVADPQSLIFAPAFVALGLVRRERRRCAPSILSFMRTCWSAGLRWAGWVGAWDGRCRPRVLAAAVFMLGGPASGRLQHTGIILSYALFPPALLLLSLALQRRSLLIAAAFGVVAAMLALGRNHEVAAAVLRAGVRCWPARSCRPSIGGAGCAERAGGAGRSWRVVAALLLAAPLLLTMQFAALSNRPEVPLDTALEASLYPANLASMAVANVMGSLESTQTYWGPELRYAARSRRHRSLVQLPVRRRHDRDRAAVVRRCRRRAAAPRPAAADRRCSSSRCSTCSGRYTPLYALAFDYVPGINLFRRPVDGAFVFVAVLAILAGHLLADYVREGLPRPAALALAPSLPLGRSRSDRMGDGVLGTIGSRMGFLAAGAQGGAHRAGW